MPKNPHHILDSANSHGLASLFPEESLATRLAWQGGVWGSQRWARLLWLHVYGLTWQKEGLRRESKDMPGIRSQSFHDEENIKSIGPAFLVQEYGSFQQSEASIQT